MNATCAGLLLLAVTLVGQDPTPQSVNEDTVRALIARLGEKSFQEREAAARKLLSMPQSLAPLREAAERSDNPEIRSRARILYNQLTARRFGEPFAGMCKRGEIDRAAELLAARKDDYHANPVPIFELARRASQAAIGQAGPSLHLASSELWFFPDSDFASLAIAPDPVVVCDDSTRLGAAQFATYICPHLYRFYANMHGAVAIGLGNLEVKMISGSFLFVHGDLIVTTDTVRSVIYCTGDIRVLKNATISSSVLIAKGKITLEYGCLIGSGKGKSFLYQQESKLFEQFRVFDPKDLGLELTERKNNRIHVAKVGADSTISRAGIKSGDYLLAVGAKTVTDIEELTVVLRRKSVEFEPIPIRIERDGRLLELTIPPFTR